MPLTREILEAFDWREEGGDETAIFDSAGSVVATLGVGSDLDEVGPLLAAAPELALACLEARGLAEMIAASFVDTDAPLGAHAGDLLRALDAALALAGVLT